MTTLTDPLLLAGSHIRAGHPARAEQVCREVVRCNPWSGGAWFILGVANQLLGRLEESVECYRRSLALLPSNAEAWNNLGASLLSLRRPEEAEPCIAQALALAPGYAEGYSNLGNALQALGRHDEAIARYRRALELKPDYHAAHDHLGLVLQAQGKLEEAIHEYGRALAMAPGYAVAHTNRALARLQHGDFANGWNEYEWRFACPEHPVPNHVQPWWDGSPLQGRTILVWTEQGLGDCFQFIRFAPLLARAGGRVVVHCASSLARVLATCPGVSQVVRHDEDLPPFDCHVPLMSLPGLFGTMLGTIPAHVPYLFPPPERVAAWGREMSARRGLKVGIAWQGNPDHKKDRIRSFRLDQFEPLSRIAGVSLFSLQKGRGAEQLAGRDSLHIVDLGSRLEDLSDAAAVLANLDLVIVPDTALAHLAGALGRPVWVALSSSGEWRWLTAREDSPWYPTLRLFRQHRWGDWDEVFGRIAGQLGQLATATAPQRLAGPA